MPTQRHFQFVRQIIPCTVIVRAGIREAASAGERLTDMGTRFRGAGSILFGSYALGLMGNALRNK
ncbi:hypothetical protein D9M71_698350 [compost metagenome]